MDACHNPKACRVGAKDRMIQKTANEFGHFFVTHIDVNQPITVVAKALFEEVLILGEERCPVKPVQKGNYVLVFDSAP